MLDLLNDFSITNFKKIYFKLGGARGASHVGNVSIYIINY